MRDRVMPQCALTSILSQRARRSEIAALTLNSPCIYWLFGTGTLRTLVSPAIFCQIILALAEKAQRVVAQNLALLDFAEVVALQYLFHRIAAAFVVGEVG